MKEFAIETFGTNDKPALLIGIGVVLAAYAGVVGLTALRHNLAAGLVGVGLFGVVGVWAASSRRASAPWHVVIPSAAGAVAGIGTLWLIHQSLRRPARSRTGTGTVDRRQFLHRSGTPARWARRLRRRARRRWAATG